MVVGTGRGYSPAEERQRLSLGEIPVDAIFSPVKKASYRVERTRIGQQTDFDKLNVEIWTDGTMSPDDAMRKAANLLVQHLNLLAGSEAVAVEVIEDEVHRHMSDAGEKSLDELVLKLREKGSMNVQGVDLSAFSPENYKITSMDEGDEE